MNFSFYIAKRYLLSKSSQNAINIINIVTSVVVVIGALALFIVLSGFAGLKTFSLSFSNDFDPDIKIEAATGKSFRVSATQLNQLKEIPEIVSFSQVVEERVVLSLKNKHHIANIKGVDAHFREVNAMDSIMYVGNWMNSNAYDEAVIGIGVSNLLGVIAYDYSGLLEIIVPKPGTKSITSSSKSPYEKVKVTTTGIYRINEDLDTKYVFTNLSLAQELLDFEVNEITNIEFDLTPEANETAVKEKISTVFNDEIIIKNRIELNDALYKMLNTENLAIYLIFTLVLILALFNVVGAIVMMILDKRKNMKTLFSMGTTVKEIKRIFFLQGIIITVLGGLLGITLGVIVIYLQLQFKLFYITASLPYPVELKFMNCVTVFLTITILGVLASFIASNRINRNFIANA
ncbi:Lipoprotein-releasing system transmembrane protein LolE [Kordia antarctica]|uniref:Lipoprotein-releasing system transmembrane protein LolE n=1 Tax=Kordia antarctica TaxID=1218801 RepID=A0A7L4ZMB1_9FLAO|nr:FtsX-like permease family protein [Kordia antarctica]QHI37637.1 Lipoprotein-releasing system transmembrane protein LolE [Kordia antarctica]